MGVFFGLQLFQLLYKPYQFSLYRYSRWNLMADYRPNTNTHHLLSERDFLIQGFQQQQESG